MLVNMIVSGGQSGADRAALDAAFEAGIACGGWCPLGRRAEDGPIEAKYPLRETESEAYEVRTALNVADSDGTLICHAGEFLTGGSFLTRETALRKRKPFLVLRLDGASLEVAAREAREWIERWEVAALNVAGPRASGCPEIYGLTLDLMRLVLGER